MKSTKINSFWTSEPPLDDLAKIQEYIKPRGSLELLGLLAPKPPLPPSVEEGVGEPQQLTPSFDSVRDELLEIYGVTPEEFVTSALEEPELWDDDQLERLHAVLSGDLAPQAIADIVLDHASDRRVKERKRAVAFRTHGPTDDGLEDLEDLFSDKVEEPKSVPSIDPDLLASPPGAVDVGNWWEKRKS